MDWLSSKALLLSLTYGLVAQSCAGINKEGPASELWSSKCGSLPAGPNEPTSLEAFRIDGLGLEDRTTFYNFCNMTYHALGVYSTQLVLKNISKKYGVDDVTDSNVLDILGEAEIEIPEQIYPIWNWRMGDKGKNYLVDLVRKQIPYIHFKLNNLSVIGETRKKCLGMDVFGRNVILSDVMDLYKENLPRQTNKTDVLDRFCNWEVRILATEKFYIDKEMEGRFVRTDIERLKYISVVAPVWEVQAGSGDTRTIKLDGSKGTLEGGFFIGVYSEITNASKLFISANGRDSKPEYDGGNAGSIHLVNISGKVTVHTEACPGSGKNDGKFVESPYMPGNVVADTHAEMITGSLFDCFSSKFEDFFMKLPSYINFTIGPLSLANELIKIEDEFYARGGHINNCPGKIKRRMAIYYETTLELIRNQLNSADPIDKKILGAMASSILTRIISNWELDRIPNEFRTKKYLEDVGMELKLLKKHFESTDIEEKEKYKTAVIEEKVKSENVLGAKVSESLKFIEKNIIPTMKMAEDVMNAASGKLLISLKAFLNADEGDLATIETVKEELEELLPSKYIFFGLQVVGSVISLLGPPATTGPPAGNLIAGGSILGAFVSGIQIHNHPSEPFSKQIRDERNKYNQCRVGNFQLPPDDDNEENDTDYLSLLPAAKDAVADLVGQIKSNNRKKEQLEMAILNLKAKTRDIMIHIKTFHHAFIPALEEMAVDIRKEITILNGTYPFVLAVKKWDIRNVLSNMRRQIQYFAGWISDAQRPGGNGTGDPRMFEALQSSLATLGEALEVIFELYGQVGVYQEWKKMTEFITIANSPYPANYTVDIKRIVVLEKRLLSFKVNLVLEKYKKALSAFNQWVFPFPKSFLEGRNDLIPNIAPNIGFGSVVNSYKKAIDGFRSALSKDMPGSSKLDRFQHYSDFKNGVSYEPFYVWTNDKWQDAIYRLFQGEQIRLKADVDMIGRDDYIKRFFEDKTAIKFKAIELFIKAHDESLQDDLKQTLRSFQMHMTHSGLSIYKVNGQHFVMRNKAQWYSYNFEEFADTKTVDGYRAYPRSDFILSPYTWWTFWIRNLTESYEKLQKFAKKVDLVLHGTGTFLDESWANDENPAFLNDLNLSEYYGKQPNDYEMLNVGEIPKKADFHSCSHEPGFRKRSSQQAANNLNTAISGPTQQTIEGSINEQMCYHKLKCDENKGNVKITGKFQLVSDPDNDDIADYLNATDYSEDFRADIRGSNIVNVSIEMVNDTQYYVETFVNDKKLVMSFKPGTEFETLLGDGRKVSNVINVNTEQKSMLRIIKFVNFEAINEAIFCHGGFKVTLKAKNATAVLTFRRL